MSLVGFFSNFPEIGGAVPTLEATGHLLTHGNDADIHTLRVFHWLELG